MSIPTKNELLVITNALESGLKSFNKKKSEFKILKADAQKIVITDIADKAGIKSAGAMRKKLKAARCEIARQSKDMRQPLTNIAFMITEREKELIAIIEPSEKEMQRQEMWVTIEIEKIEQAERDKKLSIINDRINQLAAFGFSVDTETLAGLDDDTFQAVLANARQQAEADAQTAGIKSADALHRQINEIMNDEKQKHCDDQRLMVDLNNAFATTINANPTLFEERKRLMIYAKLILVMRNEHSPAMQTAEGRDIIATANDLLNSVHKMLVDAVELI